MQDTCIPRTSALFVDLNYSIQPMKLEDLDLTVDQVAQLLGYHPNAVRFVIANQQLKTAPVGPRKVRVSFRELQRFCREHRNGKVQELALS